LLFLRSSQSRVILITFSWLLITAIAPWQNSNSRRSPWRSDGRDSDRKERRESFFKGLNLFRAKDDSSSAPVEQPLIQRESSAIEPTQEIKELPWEDYQKGWTAGYDSFFYWPIENPQISSGFGVRDGKFHEGLDLRGKSGEKIRSIGSGRVVFSGVINGYGQTIVVYHGAGLSSVYAHNRENLVRKGQLVERGKVVATLGSTGHATGSHLHFEIRKNGEPENPLRYQFRELSDKG